MSQAFQHVTAGAPAAVVEALQRATPATIDRGFRQAADVIARTKLVREVMETVMKNGMHYGTIPGTQKPTLYQPGCDVLAVAFRIAPKLALVEDLSTSDAVRYRVTVAGHHQGTNELLAEGIGECSSDEEKYRWRRPVCDEEFADTPEDRRREKWAKGSGGKPYKQKQIRTSPADVANTVLKMATKRAKVAMILNATAATDVFAQDLEDLNEELREQLADERPAAAPSVAMPQARQDAKPSASAPVTSQEPQTPAAPERPAAPTTPNTAFRRDHVRIVEIEAKKTADKTNTETGEVTPGKAFALVTLSSGEVFQCWHLTTLVPNLEKWRDEKTVVDLDCVTSKDPASFRPRIEKGAPA